VVSCRAPTTHTVLARATLLGVGYSSARPLTQVTVPPTQIVPFLEFFGLVAVAEALLHGLLDPGLGVAAMEADHRQLGL
jgi:hypothetical protein